MAGRGVVHFEIPAANVKRAKEFYTKAFGWQINDFPGMNYAMVGTTDSDENGMPKNPGAINGGMLKRQKPVSTPVITVDVEDIDASLKEIKKLGGTVSRKKEPVGDMGFAAYFKDTEGNVIGLWQRAR
jgi:uncharacterized protein